MRDLLARADYPVALGPEAVSPLTSLPALYETQIGALAGHFLMPLPAWLPTGNAVDDWQSSPWEDVSGPLPPHSSSRVTSGE